MQRPGKEPVRLTPLEAKLLETLILHAGQVLTGESLITAVWGTEGGDRTMLKQLVYRLRTKIDPGDTAPSLIETVPGIGYSFVEPSVIISIEAKPFSVIATAALMA